MKSKFLNINLYLIEACNFDTETKACFLGDVNHINQMMLL